jgi:hypothetical protein
MNNKFIKKNYPNSIITNIYDPNKMQLANKKLKSHETTMNIYY